MPQNLAKSDDVEGRYIRQVEDVKTKGDVVCKPMWSGDEMVMLEITYGKDCGAPPHVHQHETVCYVVSGEVTCRVGDEKFDMVAGDACVHPQGVPHGIMGKADSSVVLEIKSPAQGLADFLGLSDT